MTNTHTPQQARKRSPQVNIVLTAEEVALFSSQAVSWTEPGATSPRTESLGRTIKRLALEALAGARP